MAKTYKDLTGKTFGWLKAITPNNKDKWGKYVWQCECLYMECGNLTNVRVSDITSGHTKSCGCLKGDHARKMAITHGRTGTPEHHAWNSMRARVRGDNPEYKKNYTDRGITVCDRWKNNFQNFLDDVGLKPSQKHSLDRRDNNGNYEPRNVRWATKLEQASNTTRSVYIEYNSQKMTVSQWSRAVGIHKQTIMDRLRNGWTSAQILGFDDHPKSRNKRHAVTSI